MRNVVLVLAFLVIVSCPAAADIVPFANIDGTAIKFTGQGAGVGAEFTITTKTVDSKDVGFLVTGGNLAGLYGAISGVYQYAHSAITTSGTVEEASVTLKSGPNTFTIWDSSGAPFTASVAWINIFSAGTLVGLNSGATINLSGFNYAGTNADLLRFASENKGVLTASFQFVPPKSLTQLETAGTVSTSFSGTLSVPDGGMTLMLLGGALVGLETLRRRLRA